MTPSNRISTSRPSPHAFFVTLRTNSRGAVSFVSTSSLARSGCAAATFAGW